MNTDPILSGRMMLYGDSAFRSSVLRVNLKDSPDLQLLQRAVDESVKRCPWVTYGVREEGGLFYYSDHLSHSLTVSAWSDEEPPVLGGPAADGHLFGVYHKGSTLLFAFFHGLTDGGGSFSFVEMVLRCYVALLEGKPLPPEEPAYPDAEAEPMLCVDKAMQEAGIPWDPQVLGASRQQTAFVTQDKMLEHGLHPRTYLVRADARQLMAFAKGAGVKASAALVALYAAAYLRVHPDAEGIMKVAMPIDFRSVLGIPHTFKNCAMPPAMLDLPIEQGEDFAQMAERVNEIVLKQISPAAKLYMVKGIAAFMDMIPQLPYAQTEQLMAQYVSGDHAPFTFNCSYAHRFEQEEFVDLVESVCVQTSTYGPSSVIEVVALPDAFYATLNQMGACESYLQAYIDQLGECGIDAGLVETIEGVGPYVELRETLGLR